MSIISRPLCACAVVLALALTACATTGSTMKCTKAGFCMAKTKKTRLSSR